MHRDAICLSKKNIQVLALGGPRLESKQKNYKNKARDYTPFGGEKQITQIDKALPEKGRHTTAGMYPHISL